MEFLGDIFPIILYFLGAVLLIVCIILVVRLIGTVERTNDILDDLERKSQSLNTLFDAIESIGNTLNKANSGVLGFFTNLTKKVLRARRKKKRKKIEEEMDDYE